MEQFLGVLASLNPISAAAGFALGIVFGGKVRMVLAAVLERAARFVR